MYDPMFADGDVGVCPTCATEYNSLSRHWSRSDCGYPCLTDDVEGLIECLLLSGVGIKYRGNKKTIVIAGKQEVKTEILEPIETLLAPLTTGIYTVGSESESRDEQIREREEIERTHNYSFDIRPFGVDVYALEFIPTPDIESIIETFYEGSGRGKRRITPEMEGTPSRLKSLYTLFGTVTWDDTSAESGIISFDPNGTGLSLDHISSLFENTKFTIHAPEDVDTSVYIEAEAILAPEDTEEFIDFLGTPTPGYDYLWMVSDQQFHEALKGGYETIVRISNGRGSIQSGCVCEDFDEYHVAPPYREYGCSAHMDVDGSAFKDMDAAIQSSADNRPEGADDRFVASECESPGELTINGESYCVDHASELFPRVMECVPESIAKDGRVRAAYHVLSNRLEELQQEAEKYKRRGNPGVPHPGASETDTVGSLGTPFTTIEELCRAITLLADTFTDTEQGREDFQWLLNDQFREYIG